MRGHYWTPEQDADLSRLYESGLSCSQIAAELNCGVTRNAVIGRVHRLKLPLRGKAVKLARPPKIKRPRGHKRTIRIVRANGHSDRMRLLESPETDMPQLRCVEVIPRAVVFADLGPADCRYPYGDDHLTFCGHPKLEGSSYCAPHFDLTHTLPRKMSDAGRERMRRLFRANHKIRLMEEVA